MLLKVKADFHPVHGFDLIIEDIDPSFTLGDLLAKLGAIREARKACTRRGKPRGRGLAPEPGRRRGLSPFPARTGTATVLRVRGF